jgi:hypothetical protein
MFTICTDDIACICNVVNVVMFNICTDDIACICDVVNATILEVDKATNCDVNILAIWYVLKFKISP